MDKICEQCRNLFQDPHVIQSGAGVNTEDYKRITAFFAALLYSHDNCTNVLLGASTDDENIWEWYSHEIFAAFILDIGLNGNESPDTTALLYAAARGYYETVNYLIKIGADVNATAGSGISGLMLSAESGQIECGKLLIQAGADVNASDHSGNTAIMKASVEGQADFIELLVSHKAEVNLKDKDNSTCLIKAVKSDNEKVLKILLLSGAEINIYDNAGLNALLHARALQRPKLWLILLAAGEYPNEQTHDDNIDLKNRCRKTIRTSLIGLNPRSHLFARVPLLGLPPLLEGYILFYVSLH